MAAKDKPTKAREQADRTVVVNRRGRFNYDIEESLEAGLALTGTEVKSVRKGNVQLAEAFARVEQRSGAEPELWVHGMHIAPYEQGNIYNVEPRRKRKLLLHRSQINRLTARVQQKGYTLVPLKIYFTRGKAKLELGLGKGRHSHDKREAISARESRREVQRELGQRR